MSKLNITGVKPGSTSLKLTAGKITKTVPITVLSRNLLAYGPVAQQDNGLGASVNDAGELVLTGSPTGQYKGLVWSLPKLAAGKYTLSQSPATEGTYNIHVQVLADGNIVGGTSLGTGGTGTVSIPDAYTTLVLRVREANKTALPAAGYPLRLQLERGSAATAWMKPDNTSLKGGGMN